MKGEHHNFQWGKTPNALNTFCNDYVSFKEEAMRIKGLTKIFLNQKVFATEKLDGTNVGKDELGQMYGRRCLIGNLSEFYQKTSLKKVKQADIAKLKIYLCNEASIDQNKIQNFLVYGELMCNSIYDYKERDLVGEWRVFGAIIVAGKDFSDEVFEKLKEAGFAVSQDSDEERIRIFPSTKFFFCVTKCGMDTVNVKSDGDSIAQIVSDNLEDMRRGRLEGIIFTAPSYDVNQGHKVVKWKGAQEYQPKAVQFLNDVIEDIETKNIFDELKMFYRNLADVASVGPDTNPLLLKHNEFDTTISEKNYMKRKKSFGDGVSSDDKKMIIHGIYHSMNKFDDIAIYSANGTFGIETYVKILQDESRKHYVEEKLIVDDFEGEDNVLKFINSSVVKIVDKLQKKDKG